MNVYMGRTTSSLNFVHTDTGADTQGIENRWWAVKQRITRTGTPNELSNPLAGVLTMWRRHYGEVLFGNIAKHIAELYDVGNDA